ncbi:MAG: hypothetical protein JXA04_03120 [Gammaproteobacteria bacterium]|nr:hypothetical protein [Gammaproteobacteria bacterium]
MRLASFEAIVVALEKADVRYLIAGGLAVNAHGYGRMTFDVDLVIQLERKNLERAIQALVLLGFRPLVPVLAKDFADPEIRQHWTTEKNMVVFQMHSDQHPETRVDIFVNEPFDFDTEYSQALVGEVIPGFSVRFVSIQTLIEMKKAAGREKDLEDIRQLNILREHPACYES